MKPLDQNEAVFVRPNKDWSLLTDFQNTLSDFFNHFRLESFSPLHGNVDLVDWKAFRFGHSFYSLKHVSAKWDAVRRQRAPSKAPGVTYIGSDTMAMRSGTCLAGRMETQGTK